MLGGVGDEDDGLPFESFSQITNRKEKKNGKIERYQRMLISPRDMESVKKTWIKDLKIKKLPSPPEIDYGMLGNLSFTTEGEERLSDAVDVSSIEDELNEKFEISLDIKGIEWKELSTETVTQILSAACYSQNWALIFAYLVETQFQLNPTVKKARCLIDNFLTFVDNFLSSEEILFTLNFEGDVKDKAEKYVNYFEEQLMILKKSKEFESQSKKRASVFSKVVDQIKKKALSVFKEENKNEDKKNLNIDKLVSDELIDSTFFDPIRKFNSYDAQEDFKKSKDKIEKLAEQRYEKKDFEEIKYLGNILKTIEVLRTRLKQADFELPLLDEEDDLWMRFGKV